jgi:regulation of enolase protein 1 (concanavalin A-like superfamily)
MDTTVQQFSRNRKMAGANAFQFHSPTIHELHSAALIGTFVRAECKKPPGHETACHHPQPGEFFHPPIAMKCSSRLVLALSLFVVAASYADEIVVQDDFKGKLDGGWSWLREDRKGWRVTERALEVRVQPGNMWGPANNAKNVLVRTAPDPGNGELEVSLSVTNQPTAQFEQVDLVWYYDDSHMVKLGQELVDDRLSIVMGREEADKARTIAIIPLKSFSVRLRLRVSGNRIQGQFRTPDSDEWHEAGECDLPVRGAPKVSLQCYQGPVDAEHWAQFTEFCIRRLQK